MLNPSEPEQKFHEAKLYSQSIYILPVKQGLLTYVFRGRYKTPLLRVLTWECGTWKHDSTFLFQHLHIELIWLIIVHCTVDFAEFLFNGGHFFQRK